MHMQTHLHPTRQIANAGIIRNRTHAPLECAMTAVERYRYSGCHMATEEEDEQRTLQKRSGD